MAFYSDADNLVPGDTNNEVDVFAHGPYLTLEADPETVSAGDAITLTTYTGMPGGMVFLLLVDFNGTHFCKLYFPGTFDGAGIRSLSGTVPAGLSGNVITFKSAGIAPNRKGVLSNPETITFQ